MHLAVDALQCAVRPKHGSRVVVDARSAPLEQRSDDGCVRLSRDFADAPRTRPGDRLGQVEERVIFPLAEVLCLEQFGQADDLRSCV